MKINLDPISQAHSKQCAEFIKNFIINNGPISFKKFMELALYSPGLGYYCAGNQKFGPDGDFVTAPEISPLFGQCIANQCAEILPQLEDPVILELGPGQGKLCIDILTHLEKINQLPEKYYLLEISADLKQRQYELIKKTIPHLLNKIHWLDGPMDKKFNGMIIGNEIIDALPTDRFIFENNNFYKYFINWKEDKFCWDKKIINTNINKIIPVDLPNNYIFETQCDLSPWLKSITENLASGVILFIDYGFVNSDFFHPERNQGTLMCHFRHHAHSDPLINIGIQDITVHINFTHLAECALENNLDVLGFSHQAGFLLSLGLMDQPEIDDTHERIKQSQQIQTLTMPHEMGELFKVMALGRNIDIDLTGFALQDMRYKL